jgi:hypothetical protein
MIQEVEETEEMEVETRSKWIRHEDAEEIEEMEVEENRRAVEEDRSP